MSASTFAKSGPVLRGVWEAGQPRSLRRAVRGAVPHWAALSYLYRKAHGRLPNLLEPKRFTEKVVWRAAFDRREILARVSDKARARDYVIAKVGRHAVPELYYDTTDPSTIPFDTLPSRFVLKPTHASGWLAIVEDRAGADTKRLVSICEQWLARNYYDLAHEWVYRDATPRIHVEELIDDGGRIPFDYKLFVFDGEVFMIQVDANRFVKHRRALYTPDWKRIPVRMACDHIDADVPRPPHLGEMLEAASRLAEGFDFLRVDCLEAPGGFYVNELTATPCRGLSPFDPVEFDELLGSKWALPRGAKSPAPKSNGARSRSPRAPEASRVPRVSIVVCNYNYERFLGEAIRSALEQDHPATEVIVVDDGSTDGSRDVIAGFGDAVRTVFKSNGGQASAYNAGFEAVTGDFVVFLDSDDVLDPGACSRIVQAFAEDVAKVHFRLRLVDGEGVLLGATIPRRLAEGHVADKLRLEGELYDSSPGSGNAYRVSVLSRLMPIPADPVDRHGADFFVVYGSCLLGKVAIAGDSALGSYRIHGKQNEDELVFGNASRDRHEPVRMYARYGRLQRWVVERLGPAFALADAAAHFSLEKQGYALAIFGSKGYLDGVRAGAPILVKSVLPSIGRLDEPLVRRAALAGWAAGVLVLPRRAGLPLARFVCNPASR